MITKGEILSHANKHSLSPNIIEKDYVLSWILAGIANQSDLSQSWVFKGGTCLKKCFFKNYRFSEDLDFTLTNTSHIDAEFLTNQFAEICAWIYEQSGIEIPHDRLRFEIYNNNRGYLSAEGRLYYYSQFHRRDQLPRIKLDLSHDEIIVLTTQMRKIDHSYTDVLEPNGFINSYCLEEVFAEKIRALAERLRPRDLYDVIHLYEKKHHVADQGALLRSLKEKCRYKSIELPTINQLLKNAHHDELAAEWNNMLAHQISDLLPLEHYWNKLPALFQWVYQ